MPREDRPDRDCPGRGPSRERHRAADGRSRGGGGGKGAPCLTCGRFRYGGKASQLYAHISGGIKGTVMGAFRTTLQEDEILGIIAFIRVHTGERRAAGEID